MKVNNLGFLLFSLALLLQLTGIASAAEAGDSKNRVRLPDVRVIGKDGFKANIGAKESFANPVLQKQLKGAQAPQAGTEARSTEAKDAPVAYTFADRDGSFVDIKATAGSFRFRALGLISGLEKEGYNHLLRLDHTTGDGEIQKFTTEALRYSSELSWHKKRLKTELEYSQSQLEIPGIKLIKDSMIIDFDRKDTDRNDRRIALRQSLAIPFSLNYDLDIGASYQATSFILENYEDQEVQQVEPEIKLRVRPKAQPFSVGIAYRQDDRASTKATLTTTDISGKIEMPEQLLSGEYQIRHRSISGHQGRVIPTFSLDYTILGQLHLLAFYESDYRTNDFFDSYYNKYYIAPEAAFLAPEEQTASGVGFAISPLPELYTTLRFKRQVIKNRHVYDLISKGGTFYGTNDPTDPERYLYRVINHPQNGTENSVSLSIEHSFSKMIQERLKLTWNSTESDEKSDYRVPFLPEQEGEFSVTIRQEWSTEISIRYIGYRYIDNNFDTKLAPFATLNLDFRYPLWSQRFILNLRGENLTGTTRQEVAGYELSSKNYYLGASYRF